MEPDPDTSPPLPRVSPRDAREVALDPAVRDAAARAARAARLNVLENLRNDPSRVDAFRAAVACAVADGARRVVVLDAGCTGGALAVEAARAGAEQVVAFEPDPTLAALVRETARLVLPPAALRRLAVVEADASRVEACDGAGAAWRVRARDVGDGAVAGARAARPAELATPHSSFVATEKANCLVLGAFAVADAVEMVGQTRALRELRDSGVFDALLRTPAFAVIPRKTRLFAQLVAGSNLCDALFLRRLDGLFSGDRKTDAAAPALTRPCPAAARTRVQARFREDGDVTRVSDVFEMTKPPIDSGAETNRHDWAPEARYLFAGDAFFRTTIRTSESSSEARAVAAMSWWWMDVGARSMHGGDGRDEMRDAVILSSAPDDADALQYDRTVTFSPIASPLALARRGENFEGRVAPLGACVTLASTDSGRVEFFVDVAEDNAALDARKKYADCVCAAHALWGADGVARWNDVVVARRLARGISAVLNRAGADRGALLDLSDGPKMSVLAASLVSSATGALGDDKVGDDTHRREYKKHSVLCVERDAGAARFARGVARASGFDRDVVKTAAVDTATRDDITRFLGDDRETIPVLQPWSSRDETSSFDGASSPPFSGSPRETRRKKKKKTRGASVERAERETPTSTAVRVGAGAVARDARLAEARADADFVASNAWLTCQRSQAKADKMREKLAATRDRYRAAVLAAMADAALTPRFATPPARGYASRDRFHPRSDDTYETDTDRSREGDDFCVAFDAGYDRRRTYADADFDDEEWRRNRAREESRKNARDDLLFQAYCERRASRRRAHADHRDEYDERRDEAMTAELERLGLGGIDFESIDADARVARAGAILIALADKTRDAENEVAENLRRAQDAHFRALAAQNQRVSSLRAAAENALGKTPAWVFLCDPFSFSFVGKRERAIRWGDGALAETLRRRLWARSAGILYVNHLSVPREAVIAVATVSCPGLRAKFEPELEALSRGVSSEHTDEDDADAADDDENLATTLLRERLARAFASNATRGFVEHEKNENDENGKPFVAPTPVYLDDVAHVLVSRPAVAARVDLAGDGVDRSSFEWSGDRDALLEVTGSSVVDALVFWTEYDVGDGGERITTGPASIPSLHRECGGVGRKSEETRPTTCRLFARDAQGVLFLPTPLRLADGQTARFFVETRLVVQTEGSFRDEDCTAGYVEARVRSRVR